LDIFSRTAAKFKLRKRKKIKKQKFGAGTKQMNEVNMAVLKENALKLTLPTF